jgi:hypothetical protein
VLGAAVAGLSAPATSSAAVLSGTAGGDLGGLFPNPTVLKASGAAFQVTGVLDSTLAHGTILNSVGFLDSGQDTLSAVRAMCTVSDTRNGTNGPRGDSILSDVPTSAGSSFFLNSMIGGVHNTRGSYQGYTSAATINEAREGNGIYGELSLFEATLQTNRRGAYTACLEAMNAVNLGKQARAAGLVSLIQEANPLSSYTMLSSNWNDTGARGLWLGSNGANPAGTGIFINGDWARAAVYVQFNDQANYLLLSQPEGAAAPLFRVNGLGRFEWGDTNSVTSNLYNAGGGYLKTDQGLLVGGNTLALQGSAQLQNCVSASESTSASAGSHGAPPSQVAGYLTFIDSTGQSRKIAFYNT